MATFHAIPAGEFTAPYWLSTDWGAYHLSVDFDPAVGPSSLYQAQNALYVPLANANAGGGEALAREQARAIIAQNPAAWAAFGITADNVGEQLAVVHDLFRDRLYNIDRNDLLDVIGQTLAIATIAAAAGNLAGLPSPGDLFAGGGADLSGIPADLGWDFTPGPSLIDGAPIASPAASPYDLLRGIPDDLGYDFTPGPSLLDGLPPSLPTPSASSAAKPLIDAAGKLLAPLAPLVPAAIRAAFASSDTDPNAVAGPMQPQPAPLFSAGAVRALAFAGAALFGGYLLMKGKR